MKMVIAEIEPKDVDARDPRSDSGPAPAAVRHPDPQEAATQTESAKSPWWDFFRVAHA